MGHVQIETLVIIRENIEQSGPPMEIKAYNINLPQFRSGRGNKACIMTMTPVQFTYSRVVELNYVANQIMEAVKAKHRRHDRYISEEELTRQQIGERGSVFSSGYCRQI